MNKLFCLLFCLPIFSEPIFFHTANGSETEKKWNVCYKSDSGRVKINIEKVSYTDIEKISNSNAKKTVQQIQCAIQIFKDEDEIRKSIDSELTSNLQNLEFFNRLVYSFESKNFSPLDRKKSEDFFKAKQELHSILIAKIQDYTLEKNLDPKILEAELSSLFKSILVLHRDFYNTITIELKQDLLKKIELK
jgi:hypothetical protein